MDVSKIGGYSPLATNTIRFDKSADIRLMGTKPNKVVLDKETINDSFSNSRETTSAYVSGETIDRYEARKAVIMASIEKATGEEKKIWKVAYIITNTVISFPALTVGATLT